MSVRQVGKEVWKKMPSEPPPRIQVRRDPLTVWGLGEVYCLASKTMLSDVMKALISVGGRFNGAYQGHGGRAVWTGREVVLLRIAIPRETEEDFRRIARIDQWVPGSYFRMLGKEEEADADKR